MDLKLFSGSAHPALAAKIAQSMGEKLGNVVLERFPEGEIFVKY